VSRLSILNPRCERLSELSSAHVENGRSRPDILEASLSDLIRTVMAQGLEGLAAKGRDSKYELGLRSSAEQKTRVNRRHEFVIAGYKPSLKNARIGS